MLRRRLIVIHYAQFHRSIAPQVVQLTVVSHALHLPSIVNYHVQYLKAIAENNTQLTAKSHTPGFRRNVIRIFTRRLCPTELCLPIDQIRRLVEQNDNKALSYGMRGCTYPCRPPFECVKCTKGFTFSRNGEVHC